MADLSMPTRPGDSDPDMDEALRRAGDPMIHTDIHSVDNRELAIAIHVGQQMLATYGKVDGDVFAYAQAHGGLAEALRILLRALGAGTGESQ